MFSDSFCACFSLLTCCMTLCGFNWHTITHRNFFPPTMPEVVFGLTAAWIPSDLISIWFSIRSCEVGAALKASCQLVWGSKGEIDRKLPLYYQAGNMCFFLFKNEASKSCRSVQRHLSDLREHRWPRRMRHTCTGLAVCWRCKHEGQRPLAKDTSSDNPFCAVCCFHLPGHPTKIRLLHLKQNSWNPLRVE